MKYLTIIQEDGDRLAMCWFRVNSLQIKCLEAHLCHYRIISPTWRNILQSQSSELSVIFLNSHLRELHAVYRLVVLHHNTQNWLLVRSFLFLPIQHGNQMMFRGAKNICSWMMKPQSHGVMEPILSTAGLDVKMLQCYNMSSSERVQVNIPDVLWLHQQPSSSSRTSIIAGLNFSTDGAMKCKVTIYIGCQMSSRKPLTKYGMYTLYTLYCIPLLHTEIVSSQRKILNDCLVG